MAKSALKLVAEKPAASPVRRGLVVTGIVAMFFLWIKMRDESTPLEVAKQAGSFTNESNDVKSAQTSAFPMMGAQNRTESFLEPASAKSELANSMRQAQELLDRGNPAAAGALLEELLQKNPENTEALMELAMIYVLDFKDQVRAEGFLERIVTIDANHRAALNELLLIYGDETRSEQGAAFLRDQLTKHPESAELGYAFGRMMVASGRAAEAISYLERGQSLSDIRDQVLIDIADAAIRSGRLDKALESYQKAEAYQEAEMERLRSTSAEGLDYAEDRLFATRLDHARALINAGRKDEADAILSTITGHDEDPIFLGLKNQTSKNPQLQ